MTKIQRREHAKRERNRLNMMGLRQPLGTQPKEYQPSAQAVWRRPMIKIHGYDLGNLLARLKALWGKKNYSED